MWQLKTLLIFLISYVHCVISDQYHSKNVFGDKLEVCSTDPMTGFTRNGYCVHINSDDYMHSVCAEMTKEFLDFTKSQGNNLSDPVKEYGFPGLKAGNRWCLCAARWREAQQAGKAPLVVLKATNDIALKIDKLELLKKYSVEK